MQPQPSTRTMFAWGKFDGCLTTLTACDERKSPKRLEGLGAPRAQAGGGVGGDKPAWQPVGFQTVNRNPNARLRRTQGRFKFSTAGFCRPSIATFHFEDGLQTVGDVGECGARRRWQARSARPKC